MAAEKVFSLAEAIPERSTFTYGVDLYTRGGALVDISQVLRVLLTLRDVRTGDIVNSRDAIEAKDQNGGTVTTGRFEFEFDEADTQMFGKRVTERRLLTLDFRLLGGGRITRQVSFYVRNLLDVAA